MTQKFALPPAIRYIPLVPRAQPPALPPQRRVAELLDLIRAAAYTQDAEEGLARASEAMNKAALIASDTGQPDLAETLCWQQYESFLPTAPLPAKIATFALQPLVNLGRLAIRNGEPTAAYAVFESLLAAATHGHSAQVQGRTCPVADLVATPGERAKLRRFLWAVLLADGTRALCAADRWQDALDHLRRHNGIGTRLLDGRQVAVLTALHRNDPDTAGVLLKETACSEAWEHAMAACLTTVAVHAAGHDPTGAIDAMAHTLTGLPPTPGGAVFAARAGTLACELAPHHRALAAHLIDGAMESDDAHAASALLESPAVEAELTLRQHNILRERVDHAQLTGTDLPASLAENLTAVCDRAVVYLTCHLGQVLTHPTQ